MQSGTASQQISRSKKPSTNWKTRQDIQVTYKTLLEALSKEGHPGGALFLSQAWTVDWQIESKSRSSRSNQNWINWSSKSHLEIDSQLTVFFHADRTRRLSAVAQAPLKTGSVENRWDSVLLHRSTFRVWNIPRKGCAVAMVLGQATVW